MRTLNLGILAHVDAGKTSLTERLLHAAGVIDRVGRVDDGTTQTDTLALERQRGITIRSAVVSFALDGVTVNLIDTPGHPDFVAEVERVLSVLDGAVLVISAVEGVQPQTRILMRVLHRLGIPTLLFVNKIDRAGARYHGLLADVAEKLTRDTVPMGSVSGLGTRAARYRPFGAADEEFTARLADVLAGNDDRILAAYLDRDGNVPGRLLRRALAAQTGQALVHPVFFGSAVTGAGVAALTAGIRDLLPATRGTVDGPVSGTVFKVERGPAGEKLAYVRMFAGVIRTRERPRVGRAGHTGPSGPTGPGAEGRITAISVFENGTVVRRASVTAGRIAKVWGLADIRIGDVIGVPPAASAGRQFAPPTLETVVVPDRSADTGALRVALAQLAEQDPLINVRQDDVRHEISVSLYGEVHKEVIQATLADDFGLRVTFRETTTICVERLVGTGSDVEVIRVADNPFLATVGLRVDPAPVGSGVAFELAVELGSMPPAFFTAVESAVRDTLRQGLHGWEVPDCAVTMTHSGYWARQSRAHGSFDKTMSSTAGDFRTLTPLVLMSALRQAGTVVAEPVHRFELDVPTDTIGPVLRALARLRAVAEEAAAHGSSTRLAGRIPAAQVHTLHLALPALTGGEGVLDSEFDSYQPVSGPVPERPRTDHNPLNRAEYLLHAAGRM